MVDYKFFEDGEVLYSKDINDRFSSILLRDQSVNETVNVGDLVYFKKTNSLVISGATSPATVNGTYVENGTHNSQPSYTNGNYWLWYDTNDKFWKITVSKGSGTVQFRRFDGMFSELGIVFDFNNTLLWHKDADTTFRTFANATSYVNGLTTGGFAWELPTVDDVSHSVSGALLYELNKILGYTEGQGDGNVRNYGNYLNSTYGFNIENVEYYTNQYSNPPTNNRVYYFSTWNGTIFDVSVSLAQTKVWPVSRRAEGFTELVTGEYESISGVGDVGCDIILEWVVSEEATPQGMYVGDDIVLVSGLVVNMSSLVPGLFYWMGSDGKVTDDVEAAFNGTRIGRALSDSMLLLDIDTVSGNDVVEMN